MVKIGDYNTLTVQRMADFGVYLNDGGDGILLPKRFAPADVKIGDTVKVFLYHDSEQRVIATTLQPKGVVGDIVKLKVVSVTDLGAFLDFGLMKDLLVPKKKMRSDMKVGQAYLVKIYLDPMSGKLAATEWVEEGISNSSLTVKEKDEVDLLVLRKTHIGYVVIINNLHEGVLHDNEIYRDIAIGDKMKGFIKAIRPGNKIDVSVGQMGYKRVEGEAEKILRMLKENNGFLSFNDKSSPEDIYQFFAMSKKTFKMTLGNLYKAKKIEIVEKGIKLITN
jgi:predicted RNA-binding protein (virulence factor B family)